jgi:hypothetical protein
LLNWVGNITSDRSSEFEALGVAETVALQLNHRALKMLLNHEMQEMCVRWHQLGCSSECYIQVLLKRMGRTWGRESALHVTSVIVSRELK